jgi:hypothetical protein
MHARAIATIKNSSNSLMVGLAESYLDLETERDALREQLNRAALRETHEGARRVDAEARIAKARRIQKIGHPIGSEIQHAKDKGWNACVDTFLEALEPSEESEGE